VALGLESPLVLPVAIENSDLSKGRLARDKKPDGQPRELDGNRSCFAPSGGYVATLGLHQLEYILRKIHAPPGRVGIKPTFKLETWRQKGRGGANFLLWEAFVSGKAHAKGKGAHHRDAKTAARAAAAFFFRLGRCPTAYENAQVRVYRFAGLSLAGAALIAARYSFSVRNLASSVVIVKVSKNIARTKPASICVWEEPGFDDVS